MAPERAMRACALAALLLATAAPVANASSTRDRIQNDCADGELSGGYSARDLRDARNNLRTEVDEYTDCRDLLDRALASIAKPRAASQPRSSGPTAGRAAATPVEERDLQAARRARPGQVAVAPGEVVSLGVGGIPEASERHALPDTLRLALLLLGATAALGSAAALRRHVLPRRQN